MTEQEGKYWEDFLSIIYDDKSAIRRYNVCLKSIKPVDEKLAFLKYLDQIFNSSELDRMLKENYENNAGEKDIPWYDLRIKELLKLTNRIIEDVDSISCTKKQRKTSIPYLHLHGRVPKDLHNDCLTLIFELLSQEGFISSSFEEFSKCFEERINPDERINWNGTQVSFVMFFDKLKEIKVIGTQNIYKALELNFTVKSKNVSNIQLSSVSNKITGTTKPRGEDLIEEIIQKVQKFILSKV